MKICSHCKIEKPVSEYHKYSRTGGYQCYCKSCKTIKLQEYKKKRINNSFELKQKICSCCSLNLSTSEFAKNPLGKDGFNNICKKCKADSDKIYRAKNKEKISLYKKQNHNNRIKNDYLYKLKTRCRTRVCLFFRNHKIVKNKKFNEIIGCTIETLKNHLSKQFKDGMNWDNYGKWHIDHIIPLASAKTEEEVYKLCHYTNLQPLWANENFKKGKKIICQQSHTIQHQI